MVGDGDGVGYRLAHHSRCSRMYKKIMEKSWKNHLKKVLKSKRNKKDINSDGEVGPGDLDEREGSLRDGERCIGIF